MRPDYSLPLQPGIGTPSNVMSTHPALDYGAVFAATRHAYLLLSPDLRIIDANRAYLSATMTDREALAGRHMFDAFPDNPSDPAADGTRNLGASLERVLATRTPDAMALQRYDIRRPDGTFEERCWDPVNTPVLGNDGRVDLIIHHVVDVTEHLRWCGPHWLTDRSPAPVKREDLPALLAAHEAKTDPVRKIVKSSQAVLCNSQTALSVTQAQIDDSRALIAQSMALLAKPLRH